MRRLRGGRFAAARPAGRQLPEARKKRLVLVAVGLLRRGDPPTPFAREGWLIAAFRSALLLEGRWSWRDANVASREVVHEALRTLKAKRPDYRESSVPHFAQADSFSLYERRRCRQCGWRLPDECRVFCCRRCLEHYHAALHRAEAAAMVAMLAEGL
jgi:hypothetical protein